MDSDKMKDWMKRIAAFTDIQPIRQFGTVIS